MYVHLAFRTIRRKIRRKTSLKKFVEKIRRKNSSKKFFENSRNLEKQVTEENGVHFQIVISVPRSSVRSHATHAIGELKNVKFKVILNLYCNMY